MHDNFFPTHQNASPDASDGSRRSDHVWTIDEIIALLS
jgi:hypothetical protein